MCNLTCVYCYYAKYNAPRYYGLPLDKIRSVIREAEELGCRKVIFSGGEPFIRDDALEIIALPTVPTVVLSNGTLINKNAARDLSRLSNLEEIRLSFDGFEGHRDNRPYSTHQDISFTMSLLRTHRIKYSINTVLTKNNLHELLDMYHFLRDSDILRWRMQAPFKYGRFVNSYESLGVEITDLYHQYAKLIREYLFHPPFILEIFGAFDIQLLKTGFYEFTDQSQHPCAYNFNGVTIRVNGDVDVCASLFNSIGNINFQNLKEILEGQKRKEFESIKISDIEDCGSCKYRKFCGAGCRAISLYSSGNILNKDKDACESVIMFEEHILPLLPAYVKRKFETLCQV